MGRIAKKDVFPQALPSWSTCRRRLIEWEEQGILENVHKHLLALLDGQGKLRLEETYLDGSFVPAKQGRKCRKNQGRKGIDVDGHC